jgi:hypothetical protein
MMLVLAEKYKFWSTMTYSKVKVIPLHAQQAQRRTRGIALCMPTRPGPKRRWIVSAKPWPLYSRDGDRYPSSRKLGGALGPVSCVRKISPSPGVELETVQSVARRYTDYTTSGPWIRGMQEKTPPLPLLTISRWHACVLPSFPVSTSFSARFTLLPWRWEQHVTPKRFRTYTRLYGVTYCTIAVITVTAVTTLDVTACLSRMSAGNTDELVKFQKQWKVSGETGLELRWIFLPQQCLWWWCPTISLT